jgi:NADH oxidase (H2O2-forming)
MRMETSVKGVYAAGDCAEMTSPITHRPALHLLGATAIRQGIVAGVNVAGGYLTYPGALSSVVSQIFDFEVRATGLTELQALRYGLDITVGKIQGPYKGILLPRCEADHRESHPGEGVQAHHRRPDNRGEEVTLRINTLFLAIQKNMCGYELVNTDMCHVPSVCEVSESIVIAMNMAMSRL